MWKDLQDILLNGKKKVKGQSNEDSFIFLNVFKIKEAVGREEGKEKEERGGKVKETWDSNWKLGVYFCTFLIFCSL